MSTIKVQRHPAIPHFIQVHFTYKESPEDNETLNLTLTEATILANLLLEEVKRA